jgi:hypothetical protein
MKLMPRHYKILDLILDGQLNFKQIAEKVGVSPVTVTNIRNSPTFQHELSMRRKFREEQKDTLAVREDVSHLQKAQGVLEECMEGAANTLKELLCKGDDPIKLRAAQDVLDRTGLARLERRENLNKSAVIIIDGHDAVRLLRS